MSVIVPTAFGAFSIPATTNPVPGVKTGNNPSGVIRIEFYRPNGDLIESRLTTGLEDKCNLYENNPVSLFTSGDNINRSRQIDIGAGADSFIPYTPPDIGGYSITRSAYIQVAPLSDFPYADDVGDFKIIIYKPLVNAGDFLNPFSFDSGTIFFFQIKKMVQSINSLEVYNNNQFSDGDYLPQLEYISNRVRYNGNNIVLNWLDLGQTETQFCSFPSAGIIYSTDNQGVTQRVVTATDFPVDLVSANARQVFLRYKFVDPVTGDVSYKSRNYFIDIPRWVLHDFRFAVANQPGTQVSNNCINSIQYNIKTFKFHSFIFYRSTNSGLSYDPIYNYNATTQPLGFAYSDNISSLPLNMPMMYKMGYCFDSNYNENNAFFTTILTVPTTCVAFVPDPPPGNPTILGCTNPDAYNYNPLANTDDGSCILPSCDCTSWSTDSETCDISTIDIESKDVWDKKC